MLNHLSKLGVDRLRVPDDRVDAISERLRASGSARFVEREGKAQAAAPNDPYYPWSGSNVIYGGQWGDELTQAPMARDITTGRSSAVVAVVESGIDGARPDLAGQLVSGTSVIGGSTTATEPHGEYVAGATSVSRFGFGGAPRPPPPSARMLDGCVVFTRSSPTPSSVCCRDRLPTGKYSRRFGRGEHPNGSGRR